MLPILGEIEGTKGTRARELKREWTTGHTAEAREHGVQIFFFIPWPKKALLCDVLSRHTLWGLGGNQISKCLAIWAHILLLPFTHLQIFTPTGSLLDYNLQSCRRYLCLWMLRLCLEKGRVTLGFYVWLSNSWLRSYFHDVPHWNFWSDMTQQILSLFSCVCK